MTDLGHKLASETSLTHVGSSPESRHFGVLSEGLQRAKADIQPDSSLHFRTDGNALRWPARCHPMSHCLEEQRQGGYRDVPTAVLHLFRAMFSQPVRESNSRRKAA